MSETEHSWGIQAIFFSEFHHVAGPKITYQVPEEYITKEEFDTLHVYIIAKPELQNNVITVNALGHKILGCPVCIDNPKYARNALMFNLCLVFDAAADTLPYESVVKKMAGYLTRLEREIGFLSKDETKEQLPGIMKQIREELNTSGTCCIPIDGSTAVHLKLVEDISEPTRVEGHDVPILNEPVTHELVSQLDMTTQQLLSYMDGFQHIAKIAKDSDVDINIVKSCVQNLVFHGVVHLISIFQYSNVYLTTKSIKTLWEDHRLQEECIVYVMKQGHSKPCMRDIFVMYCGLSPGVTVRDLCSRYNPHALGIDEKRLIQFGLTKGLVRKMHKYPVKLPNEQGSSKLKNLYRWFNGLHSYDEICCETGLTYQELDAKVESDPSVVICWK